MRYSEELFDQLLAAEVELLLLSCDPLPDVHAHESAVRAYATIVARARAAIRHPVNLLWLSDDARVYRDFPHVEVSQ